MCAFAFGFVETLLGEETLGKSILDGWEIDALICNHGSESGQGTGSDRGHGPDTFLR